MDFNSDLLLLPVDIRWCSITLAAEASTSTQFCAHFTSSGSDDVSCIHPVGGYEA